jgi:hypothetical protein
VTFWYQKWSDWKLHWIVIVILPHYKDGTNTGTNAGQIERHARMNELHHKRTIAEMDAFQEKMVDGQEEIKAQLCSLASRVDINQEEMKAMLDACLEKMEANPG